MSIKLLKRLSCGIISSICCCLFCLLLAKAANADVCFLPTGQCEAASANLSTGCSGFDLAQAKDETGWSCTKCGDKWKCEKKSCKDDYQTGIRCTGTETKVCDETRKAGDESCCKCEDSETKCQHEGYVYKKTKTNENCKNKCPYNGDMYESCECNAAYDKATDTDKCYEYATCELGDLAGTKKYKVKEDLHVCESYKNNAQYVDQNSETYKNGENDCVLVCAEECTKMMYYQCSPKKDCKASEGKYATREKCEASLQHASVFDIFKKYIPNFNSIPSLNVVSTCYAATLDHEICWYCKTDPNPTECYRSCMPQTALDPKPLCPIDQDRNCVSCANDCDRQGHKCCPTVPGGNPSRGCIGMMMDVDETCVKCKADDPTWRAEGCEGYPCCVEEPCVDDCTTLEAPYCERNGGTWQKTGLKSICGRDCIECVPSTSEDSPCELKDGCWVVKEANNDPCANGPYSWRDSECCALDKWKNSALCKKPTCTITAGGKNFTDVIYPYDVSSYVPTVCDERLLNGLGLGDIPGACYSRGVNYVLGMIRYCGGINDFAGLDDLNTLANEMYTQNITSNKNSPESVYKQCAISAQATPWYENLTVKNTTLYNKIKSHASGRLTDFWINVRECFNGDEDGMVNFFFNGSGSDKYGVYFGPVLTSNGYNRGMCVCEGGGKECDDAGASFTASCNAVNGSGKVICSFNINGAIKPSNYKLRVWYHKVNQSQNNMVDLKPNHSGSQQITVGVAGTGQTPGGVDRCEIVIQPNDASSDYTTDPVLATMSGPYCTFSGTLNKDCEFGSSGGGCSSLVASYQTQCNGYGGTLKSRKTPVTEDVCHVVFGECDGDYYYCLKPGCSDDTGPVTCTIDPDDPDVFDPGYWQMDNLSCSDGVQRSVPGDVTLKYVSTANSQAQVTVRKGSTRNNLSLSASSGSCNSQSCTMYGGSGQVRSTCTIFGSEYSKDSSGYYVITSGQKIYWEVDGSENYTGDCSGSSDGGSTTSCSGARPIKFTNIPMSSTSTTCIDVCCGPNADVPSSYSYLGDCNGVGSTYTCPPTTSMIRCYRDAQGILHETEGVETGSGITRHCVPGWIQIPHYTRCFGSYLVGCTGG